MLPYLLRIRGWYPVFPGVAKPVASVSRNRPDGDGIALGPAVRVVCAIGIEGVFDLEMPDFAIGRLTAIGSAWDAALTAVQSD